MSTYPHPTGHGSRNAAGFAWQHWALSLTHAEYRSTIGTIRPGHNRIGGRVFYALPASTGDYLRTDAGKMQQFRNFKGAAEALVDQHTLLDRAKAAIKKHKKP